MNGSGRTVLVVGATGSIGRHVVASALDRGFTVRALVRDAARGRSFPSEVEIVVGDLTRAETLTGAVVGVDAVVFTHGSYRAPASAELVDYGAVRNVLSALGGRGARIALMSTIGATDRRGSHDWKRRAERLVRASGLPYTIVRPAWFDYNEPDQNRLVMLQGDKPLAGNPTDGAIARRQIAEVLVRSVSSEAALRKTFELHSDRGPEQKDFDPVFGTLETDAVDALDGARDPSNMPLEEEPPQIIAEIEQARGHLRGAASEFLRFKSRLAYTRFSIRIDGRDGGRGMLSMRRTPPSHAAASTRAGERPSVVGARSSSRRSSKYSTVSKPAARMDARAAASPSVAGAPDAIAAAAFRRASARAGAI